MENKRSVPVSLTTLQRLPNYLHYFKEQHKAGIEYLSSSTIAEEFNLTSMVVKKDLSVAIVTEGKPKLGYHVPSLIHDMESFLGYDNTKDAVLVGVGHLGRALMSYDGFENYGLNIVLGFDANKDIKEVNGKIILDMDKFENLVRRMKIHIGIITVPKEEAQHVADMMVAAGIRAIWNWAPGHIVVPDYIAVQNEDMASSLAILSNRLKEIIVTE